MLDVVSTVARGTFNKANMDLLAPIGTAYAVLLKERDASLSAYHRLVMNLCIKGRMDDRVIITLLCLGIYK